MIRPGDSVAMVLAHGDHELFAAGLIQHFQPNILYISRGRHPEDEQTEQQAREVLRGLELGSQVTFLPVRETDIYGRLLSRDIEWFATLRDHVAAWLCQTKADVIIADKFEWYNSIHDLCPLLVDAALETCPLLSARNVRRFDLPLAFQTLDSGGEESVVDSGDSQHTYMLTPEESRRKWDAIQSVVGHDENVRLVTTAWSGERYLQEICEAVPATRDYRVAPPRDRWKTYDDHGTENVARGRYREAITFHEHYVPIAEALLEKETHGDRSQVQRAA